MATTLTKSTSGNPVNEKKCFVICPIGDPLSEQRKRSDGFLNEVIRPVAAQCGYHVERADEDKSPGIVTDSIINKIIDADLVIADLHGHNPNVMYEVAIRHAADKPLVQMLEQGERLPFDIGSLNTIFYDSSVHGLRQWRDDLRKAIESVGQGESGSNPVSRAGLMRSLANRGGPEADVLSEILNQLRRVSDGAKPSVKPLPVVRLTDSRSRNSQSLMTFRQRLEADIRSYLDSLEFTQPVRFIVNAEDGKLEVTVLPEAGEAGFNFKDDYDSSADRPLSSQLELIKANLRTWLIFQDLVE